MSILPALLGTAEEPLREATVHQTPDRDLAIRAGSWKLIFRNSGEHELFNLKSDIGETANLADANPEVVQRLIDLMNKVITDGRSTAGAPQQNDSHVSLGKAATVKPNNESKDN